MKERNVEELRDIESPSFRDPGGRVFTVHNRIFRVVHPDAWDTLQSFLATDAAKTLVNNRQIVQTVANPGDRLDLLPIQQVEQLIEHERVPFVSYPYEWPPEMLHAAAKLTLGIANTIVDEGWRLKDATPYNVLFIGPKPIFIDLLSFEQRPPGDMIWAAHGQFVRTFLLPLLADNSFGLSLRDVFLTRRDGLEPESLYRLSRRLQKFIPPVLSLVSIPTWLGRGRFSRPPAIAPGRDADRHALFSKPCCGGSNAT